MGEEALRRLLNLFVLVVSMGVFGVFFLGSYDFLKNVEENKCQMTYMFEFPQYIKLSINNEMDSKYPMYGLYVYAEGKHIQAARELSFSGIPVLFIPGTAGSYKQVRSVASVSLRKWLDSGTPFHFDFFSIDFNEELSGVYGYVLERQREYTIAAIDKIQSLYEDFHKVVIISHSMGGIIARSIVSEEGSSKLDMIMTFATPHLYPIIQTDPEIDLFYYYTWKKWEALTSENMPSLVSIAGGDRDLIVPPKVTRWHFNMIHNIATGVPGCWASTDHLSIVWCKQLVMATVRSLFDLVEIQKINKYYSMSQNKTRHYEVFSYHFTKYHSGKSYHMANQPLGNLLAPRRNWEEVLRLNHCVPPMKNSLYVMFPRIIFREKILGFPENFAIVVSTSNTQSKNWIFGCKAQQTIDGVRVCSEGENLSSRTEILPSFSRRRKIMHLDFNDIKGYSHLVVKMEPHPYPSCVNIEVFEKSETIGQNLPGEFNSNGGIFFNFTFPLGKTLDRLLAWEVSALPIPNENEKCDDRNAIAIFRHGKFQVHNFLKNESLILRVTDWIPNAGQVLFYLDPSCKYTIRLNFAGLESAGQLFRTYGRLIPGFFSSIILMSFFFQENGESWRSFHLVLLGNAYHLTILPGFFVSVLLRFLPNDYPLMMDGPEFSPFVPLFAYLVSYILALILATFLYYFVLTSGNLFHAVLIKILKKKIGRVPDHVTDLAFDLTFSKFPITIAVVLVSLALSTCGSLAISLGFVLYLIKVFKMYEDALEDLLRGKIQSVFDVISPMNYHMTFLMIWFIITLFNLPSLLFWIKDFGYGTAPQWDLSLYMSLMILPTISILWQEFVPKMLPSMWVIHRFIFYGMGLACVIWGTHRLYVISFIMVIVNISMAVCHLLSVSVEMANKIQAEEEAAAAARELQLPGDRIESNSSPGSSETEGDEIDTEGDLHSGFSSRTNSQSQSQAGSEAELEPEVEEAKEELKKDI